MGGRGERRHRASQIDPDFVDQAFSRTAGAELIPGNRVRLLKNAAENYPAWINAIESAQHRIYFETYIIHDDPVGQQFAELLSRKASEGVQVLLLYDWVGSLWNAPKRFWRKLARSGVEVRCFNPPSLDTPLGWISRDHRKTVCVDGRLGFVSGLCVGQMWVGDPSRRRAPWRDTGIEIEGPAVREIELAFAEAWRAADGELDTRDIEESAGKAGNVSVRVVPAIPSAGSIYRLDHLITTLAKRSIWLSDAYFAGTTSYVHALRAAARSGVDVRLLIPGANDVPGIRAISRAGLRPLLESGVRVFEWNGPMMHAKTGVVDGTWCRVGSTNLNLSSWFGNWELDVVIEDAALSGQMETMYLEDLSESTEIVLNRKRRPRPKEPRRRGHSQPRAAATGEAAMGVVRLGHTVGAAIARRRELGPAEIVIMLWGAALLTVTGVVAIVWPKAVAFPIGGLCIWLAVSLLIQAVRMRSKRKRNRS
jgi:cardiolipin synthase